jgi:hypothetical protein
MIVKKPNLITLALAAACFCFSNNASAKNIFSIDGWKLYENENTCSAIASYQSETKFSVFYDFTLNRATVFITDKKLKSVKENDKFDLKLVFIRNKTLDDGWGTVTVNGTMIGEEPTLYFQLSGGEFIDDLASSDTMALLRDDIVVESLGLDGSKLIVDKLRECSIRVAKLNPSDPLAGAARK